MSFLFLTKLLECRASLVELRDESARHIARIAAAHKDVTFARTSCSKCVEITNFNLRNQMVKIRFVLIVKNKRVVFVKFESIIYNINTCLKRLPL